ncbi:hypothetical protein RclHR1_01660020 [Rhizophagus clarus]|uniref:F-box domain-containing protein n=1 Tax=Rhizophagus clarus TaxID=94130 RepID=A0A2Z6QYM7_9GLOM|nr:hypothetical protein RclHR1_01660020 [Rhizophagus clarus]
MSELNRDVLYLIFEQLQDNKKILYSCLLVSKTWCETIIPILWKNPWECLNKKKLSFNYISYCRHLNLDEILRIINENINEESIILNVQNEILTLFINENTKFTHLYICKILEHQIHLFHGVERCFSEIVFLSCSTGINNNTLTKLIETCKSIKELKLFFELKNNNCRIVKLIEAQRKLSNIVLTHNTNDDEPFIKIVEDSLIKHASTIQYCKISRWLTTNLLSSFVNLKELELDRPGVQIEIIASLIKNTSGNLIEIKVDYVSNDEIDNKKLIQAIYDKCPNIKYLKILVRNRNIPELEKLLTNCPHLNRLYLFIVDNQEHTFDWDKLFEILIRSSSTSLFKFAFNILNVNYLLKLETFKLFFDNWKGRHPMFLQITAVDEKMDFTLIERYKSEGIIKKFDYRFQYNINEDFEWIDDNI